VRRVGPGLAQAAGWAALSVAVGAAGVATPDMAHAQARTPQTVLMSENERGRAIQEQFGVADAVISQARPGTDQ
jgi:hypothetical protein